MNRDTQLKVQAYLDNELSPGDARNVSKLISSDVEARELYNELKDTREIVASNEPAVQLPESREFYWSKIERSIQQAGQSQERSRTAAARPWWLRFMAPVAGAVALFAILVSVVDRNGSDSIVASSSALSLSAPLHQMQEAEDVTTITFRSEAEGVTVVWVSTQ